MSDNGLNESIYRTISPAELGEILSEHMEWLLSKGIQGRRAWLVGADLEGVDLTGESLNMANLKGANLWEANLKGANLWEANLKGANLWEANLKGANLWEANLKGAELWEANLKGADLGVANLKGADLREANLNGANLRGANLKGAYLWEANLKGANLIRANLEGANLIRAKLKGANLWEANLKGADLGVANLKGANLGEANLKGANLIRANLKGADLRGANFSEANVISIQYDRKSSFHSKYAGIRVANCYGSPLFKRNAEDLDWLHNYINTRVKWWQRLWLFVWKWTSDYGRNFWRWALVSICIAFFFASVFYILGPSCFNIPELPGRPLFCRFEFTLDSIWLFTKGFLTTLYFSTVTFTTLGFGDVIPKNLGTAMIVMLEVVIGYIMLGGLISIFANILARRS